MGYKISQTDFAAWRTLVIALPIGQRRRNERSYPTRLTLQTSHHQAITTTTRSIFGILSIIPFVHPLGKFKDFQHMWMSENNSSTKIAGAGRKSSLGRPAAFLGWRALLVTKDGFTFVWSNSYSQMLLCHIIPKKRNFIECYTIR